MARRKSTKPRAAAAPANVSGTPPPGAADARADDAAAGRPFDMDELKGRLSDFVSGRVELSGMQAYVGMSLLKRSRWGLPPSAPDADEKPQKISLRWKRPASE